MDTQLASVRPKPYRLAGTHIMTRHFDRIDINTNGTRESLKLWVGALRSGTRSLLIGE